jgi:hypothetical protein
MSDAGDDARERDDEEPTTEELEEPSTEKEPGDQPEAGAEHDPEPSHEAVGIGVIDQPQTGRDDTDG